MRKLAVLACAMFATVPMLGPVAAEEEAPAAKPAVHVGEAVTLTATVEAIDVEKRLVTLKGPEGNVETLSVGPEVRNLAQVKPGDKVVVNYQEALALALNKAGKGIRKREEEISGTRAPLGAKPAGTITRTVDVVATIQAIDRKTREVTIRGPKRTIKLKAAEDVDLDDLKVGDEVLASYVQALAISVEPGDAAAPEPK